MSSIRFSLYSPFRPLQGALAFGIILSLALSTPLKAQVGNQQKLSDASGSVLPLENEDIFGRSTVSLGDLDGDGQTNVAIGAALDDDGGTDRGAVYVLDLRSDGTIADRQTISDTKGDFSGSLDNGDRFGQSLAMLGDVDGDGHPSLAVGALASSDINDPGSVWILELNDDGTVRNQQQIAENTGGFGGSLSGTDKFGSGVASLGDLDADGNSDLAIGARATSDGGLKRGAVWIVDLKSDGTVADEQKISDTDGNFGGQLDNEDKFGFSLGSLGNLDSDDTHELVVGTVLDDDGGGTNSNRGAVWILSLKSDGTVADEQKISSTAGSFGGSLSDGDRLGNSLAQAGDLNSDGVSDLIVGAIGTDDGGTDFGAVWVLYLSADGTVANQQKISSTNGGFDGSLGTDARFGGASTLLGDLDGNGVDDFIVGAQRADGGGTDRGVAWVLFGEQSLLPVEFAGFNAHSKGKSVQLTWNTTSEVNNTGFEVERRVDQTWTSIGFVPSNTSGDATATPQSYQFQDTNVPFSASRVSYRLKQVDTDGTTSYSEVRVVERSSPEQADLGAPTPNPVRSSATIPVTVPEDARNAHLTVFDVLGRQVHRVSLSDVERKTVTLDTSTLSNGSYFLRLTVDGTTQNVESEQLNVLH